MGINLFEYATRNKLRFTTQRGLFTLEQLWEVPLRSTDDFNLNHVAKAASKEYKAITEENFVETAKTVEHTRREVALDVVKYVIEVKVQEEKDAKQRADNKVKKEKLLRALAEKQDGKLSEMSEKELKKQISELED